MLDFLTSATAYNCILGLYFTETLIVDWQDLMIKKLNQCCNVFNFMDPMIDVKNKEIKRATLSELIEHVTMNRNVLTDAVYPEIVKMVSTFCSLDVIKDHEFEVLSVAVV